VCPVPCRPPSHPPARARTAGSDFVPPPASDPCVPAGACAHADPAAPGRRRSGTRLAVGGAARARGPARSGTRAVGASIADASAPRSVLVGWLGMRWPARHGPCNCGPRPTVSGSGPRKARAGLAACDGGQCGRCAPTTAQGFAWSGEPRAALPRRPHPHANARLGATPCLSQPQIPAFPPAPAHTPARLRPAGGAPALGWRG